MSELSKIEQLIFDEIGYVPLDENDGVEYLRKFIKKAYEYVERCGADPDEQLFDN